MALDKAPKDQIQNYTLISKADADKFYVSAERWELFRDLAKKKGWKPAGTKKPFDKYLWDPKKPWEGWYAPACTQWVTATDAKKFAVNLKKSIKGKGKDHEAAIRRLYEFCKKGPFFIYPH